MLFKKRDLIEDLKIKVQRLRNQVPLEDCLSLYIFSILRSHIESNNLNAKFPYIKFYADWMLHPKLDFNKTGKTVVKNITEVIKNNQIPLTLKTQEINRKLGHLVLHEELNVFFEENGIDNMILKDENWKSTFGTLARLITSKPISLKGEISAHFKANEISDVNYDGYPTFWLHAKSGEAIKSYIACIKMDDEFSEDLIAENEVNGTIVFEAGLFWDAL